MNLTLKTPIEIGQLRISTLVFRNYATANDLLAFDEVGQQRQTIQAIANLTGQEPEVIGKLSVVDYRAADKIASRLLNPTDDDEETQQKKD